MEPNNRFNLLANYLLEIGLSERLLPSSLIRDIVDIYYASIHDKLSPVKCTAILAKRIIEE